MTFRDLVLGRPLAAWEQASQHVGPLAAIPVLGLDALASAAYGPEAALTVLMPLGAAALPYMVPISAAVVVLLFIVAFAYRQTIVAYPDGGGAYTVAKENLGQGAGLLAAAALALDYVMNVAVATSAGVGALASAFPPLLPWTLPLCLGILAAITIINLRGIRTTGLAFLAPTYLFVICLGITIAVGVYKMVSSDLDPIPVAAPPPLSPATSWAGPALFLHAFSSGCTAMTGVEAVSNAGPIFRPPAVPAAQRTLSSIVGILAVLLAGVAVLSYGYGIGATRPGEPGYESVLSQMVGAIAGREPFYYLTMVAIISVLCLSANTSFAAFPRLCQILARDGYLPPGFARRGPRFVSSHGILLLAVVSGALLIAFGGITNRLIPLFAVGTFLAFTMAQFGMALHWLAPDRRHRAYALFMALGACATAVTLIVITVFKFSEGAWIVLALIPATLVLFRVFRRRIFAPR